MNSPVWLRPAGGAVAVAALVVAAALLVALAADVLRWDRQLRDGDAAYGAGATATWRPDTLLPRGVSASLLGVSDDVDYRLAVDRFWRSGPREPIRVFQDVTRRSAAERTLGRTFDRDPSSARRSDLAVLRAALMLEEGRNSPTQRQVFVRRAIELLQRAVILDPANGTAVYDLELALKLLRASGSGISGSGDTRSPLPSPGAGSATTGTGFDVNVSFLTPWAALVGLVGGLGVLALLRGRRRSAAVAASLGLPPAGRRATVVDLVVLGAVAALVALAAAQPVVARSETTRGRDGAEVLVVLDVTRSMLARRAPGQPTRLDRARAVAKRLRNAIPETRVGVASLSDRILPHLFPTLGANAFAAVVDRAIGIERPPPDRRARRATAFAALGDLGRVAFFRPDTQRRIAVVVSDGETIPVDLEVLSDRLRNGRVAMIFVQVWRRDEAVFDDNGNRDPAYRPDPTSSRSLRLVAGAVGAPVINEGDTRGIVEAVRARLGTGPLVPQGRQLVSKELAPQALLAAFVPLVVLLYRRNA